MALSRDEEDGLVEELASRAWQSLRVSKSSHAPLTLSNSGEDEFFHHHREGGLGVASSLLFKSKFTASSYALLVTDGINVWATKANAKRLSELKSVELFSFS